MTTAQHLARRYDDAVSRYWRGEPTSLRALETWLAACWSDTPAQPTGSPTAFSPHAAGGRGIRWYEGTGGLVGVVPGRSGGYRVPVGAALVEALDFQEAVPPPCPDGQPFEVAEGKAFAEAQHQPLDELATVVMEQYGDTARSAVARLLEREPGDHQPEPTGRLRGHAYDLREVARQPIQAGRWVTVGEVVSPTNLILVEVDVATGLIREVEASPA